MTQIKEMQEKIKILVENINKNHNHSHPELISFLKIVEELGEITQVLIKTQIKSRKHDKLQKEEVKEEVGDEIADAIIALLSLANDFNVNIEEHLEKKFKKHQERNNNT